MTQPPTCTLGFVEDDEIIRENLRDFLEMNGFVVRAFSDRPSAFASFSEELPDIAVLDVALGAERDAGFTLCRQLREITQTMPIVFLTSHDAEADKISGLRMGADDYLSKDYSLQFLVVRLQTLLARAKALAEPPGGNDSDYRLGDLRIDEERSRVWWKGKEVPLPLTQYWMVAELAKTPSEAKSSDALMRAANIHVAPNTIAAHIRSIRQRFGTIDADFDAIRTERGLGYRWVQ